MKARFEIEWDGKISKRDLMNRLLGMNHTSNVRLLLNEPGEYCTCPKWILNRDGFMVVDGKCTRCYKTVRPKDKPEPNSSPTR